MENYKSSPMYKFLVSLKCNPKTNLAKGQINNKDAIVLLFSLIPNMTAQQLMEFSLDWRGSESLSFYFILVNQHTGPDYDSQGMLYYTNAAWGDGTVRKWYQPKEVNFTGKLPAQYWYRQQKTPDQKAYTNALNAAGMGRLLSLTKELQTLNLV